MAIISFLASLLFFVIVEAHDSTNFEKLCSSGIGYMKVGDGSSSRTYLSDCGENVGLAEDAPQTETKILFPAAQKASSYVLIMVDPDATPCNSWLHWIKKDVKGSELSTGTSSSGNTLVDYTPPNPPPGVGPHRYFTLAFSQPTSPLSLIGVSADMDRCGFSVSNFIKQNKLEAPVAVNMYKAENDFD